MKRLFALTAIFTLLITTAVGCSKKPNPDAEITPTGSVTDDSSSADRPSITLPPDVYISFGGSYSRDNIALSFGIVDSSWTVSGFLPGKEESVILNGVLTPKELPSFTFTEGEDTLTFTFEEDSVKVDVNSGTKYSGFAGTYKRLSNTTEVDSTVRPEKNSSLEQLGRIALAFYIVGAKGSPEIGIDISASSFDTVYMQNFILAYTDLFLTTEAELKPEIFNRYLCYTYTADELDTLLRNASFGKFTLADLNTDDNVIYLQDGMYHVPCYGAYAGGLTVADKNVIAKAGTITITGNVAELNGPLYTVEMTLTTVNSTDQNTSDIIIESMEFKTK